MSHADGHDQTKTHHQKCFHRICINLHTITLSVRMPAGAETNATAIAEPTVWTNYARRKLKSSRKKKLTVCRRETIGKQFVKSSSRSRVLYAWYSPSCCHPHPHNQHLQEMSGVALHWFCEFAMRPRAAEPNKIVQWDAQRTCLGYPRVTSRACTETHKTCQA